MSDKRLPLYGLRVKLCTGRRFSWDILADGRPIQSSPESFATKEEAEASGFAEIEKLIWTGRRPVRSTPNVASSTNESSLAGISTNRVGLEGVCRV
jgi:hypothetical protein